MDTLSGSTETYVFSTNDKNDTLRWIEAIDSCIQLDPSPVLLNATGGAILHTGYLNCHRYHNGTNNYNPLQPMVNVKLGETSSLSNSSTSANYGKLWSVLKQTGEIECMVDGKPERLISIKDCSSIRVQNPQTMREGSDYCLKFFIKDTVYVLKAEFPTDHYDWTMAIERVLQDCGKSRILVGGDKSRENGYVALKRLMSLQKNGGIRGSQLMSPMVELEALQDLYDNSMLVNRRASPDGCEENLITEGPPVPPRGSSAPPPPLPPKDPPPLPPKRGGSLQRVRTPSMASSSSGLSMEYDEYVTMQPPPSSLKLSSPIHMMQHTTTANIPSPITEGDDYMPMNAVVIDPAIVQRKENLVPPSQPISIPNMPVKRTPSGKRSILLRSTSDSDSSMVNIEVTPPLPPRGPSPRHHYTSSLSSSLSRNPSASSITSIGSSANSTNFYPRSGNDRCYNLMGNRAPMFIPRSNSIVVQPVSPRRNKSSNDVVSASDGMIVRDAREKYNQEMLSNSYVGSVSSVMSSENGLDISGLSSSCSSTEDISQVFESSNLYNLVIILCTC